MPKVTRDDVARLAETSTAVVSYVINNGPRPVAPATRQRVLLAIEQLGYRPNRMAQAMASGRTDLIGLIVPDARQPFLAEMAHAVERVASEREKMLLVGNSDYRTEREVHYLRAEIGGITVVTDDVGGVRLATRHLLEHGHERVACVGGPEKTLVSGDPVADHVVGWRQAMQEAGLPTQGLLFHTPYTRYHAYRAGLELLSDASRPPAVFCAT